MGLARPDLLLFSLKLPTPPATDIDYYQFVFWAIIVQFVTGSFALGVAAAVFMNLIVLLIADIIAPSLQEYYGYENVTLTSVPQGGAPFAMIVRWLIKKLNIKEYSYDMKGLTEKFGFWGDLGHGCGGIATRNTRSLNQWESGELVGTLLVVLTVAESW
jgi:PTS system galactitol-specific IIC component